MSWNDSKRPNKLGKRLQLCWSCKKCTGFCSWSRKVDPQPIEGWDAEEDAIGINWKDRKAIKTFRIYDCPLFEENTDNNVEEVIEK